ncbi:MAG: hypothetical protein JWQ02_3462 [Capsulimonas sp.]|jgi:hypothetical protein|nr:hypothetical protein [Capsulimonas sp.]
MTIFVIEIIILNYFVISVDIGYPQQYTNHTSLTRRRRVIGDAARTPFFTHISKTREGYTHDG